MVLEQVDRRILGAVRLINAVNGLPITRGLTILGDAIKLIRNRHGDYVIADAEPLVEHTLAFESPPGTPALRSVKIPITISDPAREYLPQKFMLELPRDPDAHQANSLFEPVLVPLFLSPTARAEMSWVLIQATVREHSSQERLPWSLVQILKASDNSLLATGMADGRGEALLVVAGILFAMPADDSSTTVTKEIEVRIKAHVDKASVKNISDADILQMQADPNRGFLPNPIHLETLPALTVQIQVRGDSSSSSSIKIAAGQTLVADLLVNTS